MDQQPTNRYKRLLASASGDAPKPDSLQRTAVALGLSSVGAASSLLAANKASAAALQQVATASAVKGAAVAAGGAAQGAAMATAGAVNGAAVATAAGGASVAALSSLGAGTAAKVLVASLALGGLTLGGSKLATQFEHPPSPSTMSSAASSSASPRLLHTPPARAVQPEPAPDLAPIAVPAEAPAQRDVTPVAPSVAVVQKPRRPEAPSPSANSGALFEQELALLTRARSALRAGDPAQCLSTTNQYLSSFPRGVLQAEAQVLRIEALQHTGARSEAQREARAFLEHFPQSAHRKRFEQLGLITGDALPE
jgi:hypothetical protein